MTYEPSESILIVKDTDREEGLVGLPSQSRVGVVPDG